MPSPWGIFGGGGGGSVNSVTGTAPITVNNTDPANPIVGLSGSFVSAEKTDNFTAILNQTVFNLSAIPSTPSAVLMFVNGVQYEFGIDFTIAGAVLTWLNIQFNMAAGFIVSVNYGV